MKESKRFVRLDAFAFDLIRFVGHANSDWLCLRTRMTSYFVRMYDVFKCRCATFLKVVGFKCTIHSEEDKVALTVAQCEQIQILNWLGFDKFVFSFNVEENIIIHPAYYLFKCNCFCMWPLLCVICPCHLKICEMVVNQGLSYMNKAGTEENKNEKRMNFSAWKWM